MNEKEVTYTIVNHLTHKLRPDQSVITGEIPVGDTSWRSDIIVKHRGMPVLAIECKGEDNIRRGVGQALSYKYTLDEAGIAAYNIDDDVLSFISKLPIYCFNVRDDRGFVEVIMESKPDKSESDVSEQLDVERPLSEVINELRELKDEKRELENKVGKLRSENREMDQYISKLEGVESSYDAEEYFDVIVRTGVDEKTDMNVSNHVYESLNAIVLNKIYRAARRARMNGRKTVMAKDL